MKYDKYCPKTVLVNAQNILFSHVFLHEVERKQWKMCITPKIAFSVLTYGSLSPNRKAIYHRDRVGTLFMLLLLYGFSPKCVFLAYVTD